MPLGEIFDCLVAAVEIHEPLVPPWAMEWAADIFLGAWLFCVGASVGSFLNVVVYRLPRGLNLVYPPSRCPHCLHPIRLRDNIPVLSWLLLGGKCRDCRAPISSRYFFVESCIAGLFLFTALAEGFLLRSTHAPPGMHAGRPLLTPFDAWPFWCAYATHVLLLTTLVGAALIDWDGFRTPRRLFVPVVLLGLALPIIWPAIRRLPAVRNEPLLAWQQGLIDGAAGLGAGLMLGLLIGAGWWLGSRRRGWPKFAPAAVLGAIGVVAGWQRVIQAGASGIWIFLILVVAARVLRAKRPLPFAIAPAPFLWIMLTELDSDWHFTLQTSARAAAVGAFVVGEFVLSAASGALAPSPYFELLRIQEKTAGSGSADPPAPDTSPDKNQEPPGAATETLQPPSSTEIP